MCCSQTTDYHELFDAGCIGSVYEVHDIVEYHENSALPGHAKDTKLSGHLPAFQIW